ncbi:MAG: DUF512 domain-containing protein [Lachnospiraceae bacterium]|nr:DUF512 domain-containing protein [Lachnospiraceae bacterium]
MRKTGKHIVSKVLPGSIAEELEIEPGDELVSVCGKKIEDILDYHYLMNDEYVELLIRKPNGEEWELEIEKEYEDDIGIEFENGLMDDYRSCHNKCIFCFIDQMPKGMRDTLYFKDDDSRLSFLQGNYVTLTNMSDHDIDRIVYYHMEPMNISFQTMNPDLRCKMLHNRFAGEALKKVDRFYEAGIHMNGQIVLCKGVNDGAELDFSIRELTKYLPYLQSVSVVPVGLSKYRDGLFPLEPFEKEDAREVLDLIHSWQKRIYQEDGIHFIHASDEWYILAGQPFPPEEQYDGYLQLENGVGMMRLLLDEVKEEIESRTGDDREHTVSVATGLLAAPVIQQIADELCEKYPNVTIHVYPIQNDFFGEKITVSGLLTGQDLQKQLTGKELGKQLLLPCNILRTGYDVFLDDMTVGELEKSLQVDINIVKSSGRALIEALLLETETIEHSYTDEVNKYE